ncbi:unnamed protein product, partial [Tetraodon nigroviridis]
LGERLLLHVSSGLLWKELRDHRYDVRRRPVLQRRHLRGDHHRRLHLPLPSQLHRLQLREEAGPLQQQTLSERRAVLGPRSERAVSLSARLRRRQLPGQRRRLRDGPLPERRDLSRRRQRLHLFLHAGLHRQELQRAIRRLRRTSVPKRRHVLHPLHRAGVPVPQRLHGTELRVHAAVQFQAGSTPNFKPFLHHHQHLLRPHRPAAGSGGGCCLHEEKEEHSRAGKQLRDIAVYNDLETVNNLGGSEREAFLSPNGLFKISNGAARLSLSLCPDGRSGYRHNPAENHQARGERQDFTWRDEAGLSAALR